MSKTLPHVVQIAAFCFQMWSVSDVVRVLSCRGSCPKHHKSLRHFHTPLDKETKKTRRRRNSNKIRRKKKKIFVLPFMQSCSADV